MSREIKPKRLIKFLLKLDFYKTHQKGSHLRLAHSNGKKVTIAMHDQPIAKGTLSAILRQAGLSQKDLKNL